MESKHIERFHIEARSAEDPRTEMTANESGDWILWSDHEQALTTLASEHAKMKDALETVGMWVDELRDQVDEGPLADSLLSIQCRLESAFPAALPTHESKGG